MNKLAYYKFSKMRNWEFGVTEQQNLKWWSLVIAAQNYLEFNLNQGEKILFNIRMPLKLEIYLKVWRYLLKSAFVGLMSS